MLRGVAAGVLLFHLANLLGRGPRPAARTAQWMFTLSLLDARPHRSQLLRG